MARFISSPISRSLAALPPRLLIILAIALSSFALPAQAGESNFHAGPVFANFGKIATIQTDMSFSKRAKFRVLFDSSKPADVGTVNRNLNTVARFINMHAEAGVPEKNIKAAIVFHGKGSFDLTKNSFYSAKYDTVENGNAENGAENGNAENENIAIIKALTEQGVRVILCGQTAAYYDITKADLLPGVEMALSAMTAHALLQQQGYTPNPF